MTSVFRIQRQGKAKVIGLRALATPQPAAGADSKAHLCEPSGLQVVAEAVPAAFGLSPSTRSRWFIRADLKGPHLRCLTF
jgi:hypothetical protein